MFARTRKINKIVNDPRIDQAALRMEGVVGANPPAIGPAELDPGGRATPALVTVEGSRIVAVPYDGGQAIGLDVTMIDGIAVNARKLTMTVEWSGSTDGEATLEPPRSSPWTVFTNEQVLQAVQQLTLGS
ncbi:hypothetical protein DVS28_a1089 [Euzebya pacifica]|uniref:Uncharacterized protein n=2 Tax=Euzebya pacifica TaxID=1608957 RepID=A0A346XU93_9ACTN|nr:hypothetical protein DVS28_a1089 [Euzebya pacifica]